jgi:hypothetical protein
VVLFVASKGVKSCGVTDSDGMPSVQIIRVLHAVSFRLLNLRYLFLKRRNLKYRNIKYAKIEMSCIFNFYMHQNYMKVSKTLFVCYTGKIHEL